jgi:hypothetical protein
MTSEDLVNLVLVLAPGFVAITIFDAFGQKVKMSEWQWTTWSVICGVAIALGVGLFGLDFGGKPPSIALPGLGPVDLRFVPERLVVGALAGVLLGVGARFGRQRGWAWSRLLERRLTASAWDLVLNQAVRSGFGVEVATSSANRTAEVLYYGFPSVFGLESEAAEPWIYLTAVWRRQPSETYKRLERTDGVLLHRGQIRRIRVVVPSVQSV